MQRRQAIYFSHLCGCPTDHNLLLVIRSNFVKDCSIMQEAVRNTTEIFGKDIAALKGKSTRRKPPCVVNNEVEVPQAL